MNKPEKSANLIALKLPKMGESITEGTIINWLVEEGESFNEGDIILEVATDKVDNEVPAPFTGKLLEKKFDANDVVGVGQTLAVLEQTEKFKEAPLENKKQDSQKLEQTKEQTRKSSNSRKTNTNRSESHQAFKVSNENQFFSPLVLKIAKEHHISFEELARIPSTGKEGRLRKSDIFQYIDEGRPYKFAQPITESTGFSVPDLKFDKGEGKIIEMDRMRRMIADHMVYSKHTSPHVTSYVEADLTNMVKWRNKNKNAFQEKHGSRLTFTPLFVEAVAKAIRDFPNINASVDDNNIIVKENINVGMATALPNGNLIVPVIKDADKKDLEQLATDVNDKVEKARNNNLGGDDIKGSTFTISNVGTFGSLMGTPIINQPEVAILALGIIKKRPEVIETANGDEIAIRSMMYLSLSFDHRVVDGFLGGSFLKRVAENLENFDENRTI